jgi:hypothetical protein
LETLHNAKEIPIAAPTEAPSKALNHRHRAIALMLATGKKEEDIARLLEYPLDSLTRLLESPLFKAEVERLRSQMSEMTVGSVIERVSDEQLNTVDTLVELRDAGTPQDSVRLAAARELRTWGESVVPGMQPKRDPKDVQPAVHIHFGAETMAAFTRAKAEEETGRAVEIAFEEIPSGDRLESAPSTPYQPRSIEELTADFPLEDEFAD